MENILLINSHAFAVKIIKLFKSLTKNSSEQTLPRELLKFGTSIGALVREAQNAGSRVDFVHKLGIAQKKCGETIYWLELLVETCYIADYQCFPLNEETESLLKILKSPIINCEEKYAEVNFSC